MRIYPNILGKRKIAGEMCIKCRETAGYEVVVEYYADECKSYPVCSIHLETFRKDLQKYAIDRYLEIQKAIADGYTVHDLGIPDITNVEPEKPQKAIKHPEMAKLVEAGYKVKELQPAQFRINGVLDLYPKSKKFFLISTNRRGKYENALAFCQESI